MKRIFIIAALLAAVFSPLAHTFSADKSVPAPAPVVATPAVKQICKIGDPACKVTSGTAAITLVAPTCNPIAGNSVQIIVQGIPEAQLVNMQAVAAPASGVTLIKARGLQPTDPVFIMFTAANVGTYTLVVASPDGANGILMTTLVVTVEPLPSPPGPIPTPPGPTPVPVPVPVPTPAKGRVLTIYDPAAAVEGQREIVTSPEVRAFLVAHTLTDSVNDPDIGATEVPAIRFVPLGTALPGTVWKPLADAAAGKIGVIVQVGATVQRFDIPASPAEFIKLLTPLVGN